MHRQTPKAPSFGILTQLRPGRNRPRPQSRGVSTQPGPKGDPRRSRARPLFLPINGHDEDQRWDMGARAGSRFSQHFLAQVMAWSTLRTDGTRGMAEGIEVSFGPIPDPWRIP